MSKERIIRKQPRGQKRICMEGLLLYPLKLAQQPTGKRFISELEVQQHSYQGIGTPGTERGTTWRSLTSLPDRSGPPSPRSAGTQTHWDCVPGAGGISWQTPATQCSCHHLWGMTPSRGHCPLGLGRPPGDRSRGERRGVLQAKLSGVRALG